ncbi:MAG: hypothetical protein OEX18_03655 [Candidatus Krumholzibacteria bacterium]|nr:hypothetical protein [Candidatus Krumholzibacteria bacterium]MDH4336356.1 hypothetical protein [Candidatus Krumholzibacteria bacterium]MDH5269481.1 hypothetical protein [Candidatus Krumholzibacteria bacterium]MDH5626838.1 hypothetical protein [Candidatus Krumholzibacteria bacterium]
MSQRAEFWLAVDRIREGDARYKPDAYAFVMEAVDYTVRSLGVWRHVSAAELVEGLRRAACDRYGMLAFTVLEKWGVRTGSDVGEIVFQLIDEGFLSRQDDDSREAFDEVGSLASDLVDRYFETG